MKYLKMLGLAGMAVAALTAFVGASTASATTLEIGGVTQNGSITITASPKSGTSIILRDTAGLSQNTCTAADVHGSTDGVTHAFGNFTPGVYTGYELRGKFNFSFSNCTNEPVVVHSGGILEIVHIAGTTHGTVTLSGFVATTASAVGTLTCETGEGVHLGTLTGVASGHATFDVNAQLPCSGISSRWTGTYTITSPTGLGVSP